MVRSINDVKKPNIKKLTFSALMLSLIVALSTLESMLPPLPFLPPNFRLGLSNIVVMYCVIFFSKPQAAGLNALKAFFIFLTRGPMAALLSFCGGMLSVFVIILLLSAFGEKVSYLALSVSGAISHNIGQFIALFFVLDKGLFIYYLPFMLAAGIITGILTGILLKAALPYLEIIKYRT